MPRATRSTAKQQGRGKARAATSRKTTTKAAAKTTSRGAKSTTARRTAATKTAKTKRTATAASAKTAARSRSTTKVAKSRKTAARPAKTPKAPAKAPSRPAKPVKKALKPEDKKFLQLLLAERATYTQQAETLKAEADQLAEDMEPGDIQFDEESGEGGTMNVERERDLALSAQAHAAVEEIDRALAKIADGTYGYCEQCGQPIPKARLKALPYAALCVACKSGGLSRR